MKYLKHAMMGLALTGLGVAQAGTIDYTVSGWGPTQFPAETTPPANAAWGPNGYPGDTVAFVTYTGTLDLTPGTSIQKINTLTWAINYTYGGTATAPGAWTDLSFNISASHTVSFGGGPAGSLSQAGLLTAAWDNDYLGVNAGSTMTFLVPGYRIAVTPLGVEQTPGSNFDGDPAWSQPNQDIMATFDITAVPEPAAVGLVASVGRIAFGGLARLRRGQG